MRRFCVFRRRGQRIYYEWVTSEEASQYKSICLDSISEDCRGGATTTKRNMRKILGKPTDRCKSR